MRERRRLLTQLLELVLREIPDRETLPRGAFPRERIELAGQYPDQRRLAGAVRPEKARAGSWPQAELHIFKHDALAVAGHYLRQRDQRVRRAIGSAKLEVEGHVHVGRRDALQPVQRLETALRLPRLRGLGTEARDESRHVRDLALLLLVSRLLHCQLRCPLPLELRIVAGIGDQAPIVDVQHMSDAGVEELTIMRYQEQRARIARQPPREPQHRVEVA